MNPGLSNFDVLFALCAIAATSLISGLFGSAGGSLLLGGLLLRMDVATAMILFSVAQLSSNVWRSCLWFRHIDKRIFLQAVVGSFFATALMSLIAFVPNKAFVYICLGSIPFIVGRLPKAAVPDISKPGAPYLCGGLVMMLMLMAGASGGLLDIFFQRGKVPRKTVVATKAAIQAVTLVVRMAYFGSLTSIADTRIPANLLAGAVICSLIGTLISAMILNRITDAQFRKYTGYVVGSMGVSFFGRGLWLSAH